MKRGFAVPVSGAWATPDNLVEVASRAESAGYASTWVFQRLLSPVDADGAPALEPQYRRVEGPLCVLGFLAASTQRVRLGVAVLNAPYYSPVVLAKELTTIDRLSKGRLDVGIGLGWLRPEFDAAGVPYEARGARTEDFVACLEAIWTDDVVDYQGPFYRVPRSRVDPKPYQRPHPPLLFGGTAPPALRRAGRLGAGWISSSRADPSSLADSIEVVRRAATDAGRDPAGLRFVCRAVAKVRRGERAPLVGSLDDIEADLGALEEAGVTEAFVDLNFDPTIASPDADPGEAMARAREVLEALAPAG